MNFRKNIANYITWGLMCIILFAGVGVSAIGVSEKAGNDAYLIYVGIFYLIFLALIVLLVPAYRIIKEFVESKINLSGYKPDKIMSIIFFAVIIIASLIIRFAFAISVFLKADSSDVLLGTTAYYDFAQGTVSQIGTANNGAYLFTSLMAFLFGLFDNNMLVVYVVQAIFALGTMLFTFFTIKKISGNVPAVIYLLFAAFLPGSLELFMYCTPGLMLAFLISGYFFGIVHLIKAYLDNTINDSKIYVYYVLAGVLTGFICYFDPIGLLLIPLTVFGLIVFRKIKDEDSKPEKHENTKLHVVYYLAGSFGFLIFSLFSFPAGIGAGISGIARYFSLFVPNGGLNLSILTPHYGNYDSLALYVFAGLWFLAFLKAIRDRVFPVNILCIFMVLFYLFNFDHLDYSALMSTCFIFIGCYGLYSLNFLILPVEAENVEQARQKLADMDRKKREKENKKLEKKLEKQSLRAIKHGNGIILGKNIEHDAILDEDENTNVQNTTETKETTEQVAEVTTKQAADTTTEQVAEATAEQTTEAAAEQAVEVTETQVIDENAEQTAETVVDASAGTNVEQTTAPLETTEEVSAGQSVENNSENATEGASETVLETVAEENLTDNTNINNAEVTIGQNAVEMTTDIPADSSAQTPVEETVSEVAEQNSNTVSEEIKTEEHVAAESKKEMPVYVPMVMVRRRGKMFSPVKKAEPAPEAEETTAEVPDLKAVSAQVAAAKEASLAEIAVANAEAQEAPLTKDNTENNVVSETTETIAAETNNSEALTYAPATETNTTEVYAEPVSESAVAIEAETTVADTVASDTNIAELPVDAPSTEAIVAETTTTETPASVTTTETPAETTPSVSAESAQAEETKEVKLIKNPVPGPKAHVPKELVFDYDPREDELDFDLKDLGGKDFYDI